MVGRKDPEVAGLKPWLRPDPGLLPPEELFPRRRLPQVGAASSQRRSDLSILNRSTSIVPTDLDRGDATVVVTSGSGVVVCASGIDNRTNDPITVPAKQ
ncbi:MAG TPA: hypothetical protein P5234_09015 [Thermoanaerobaculaceae bacterium]|nr:hypothetical protein [Thermoanaerobaculaceae bacterium]HRS16370.1 hypothetical protein [Thermoanaerobaculaceae bacterium]